MKKFAILAICVVLSVAAPVFAAEGDTDLAAPQIGVPGFPDISSPTYVAMVYHRLMGQLPNFESWARFTPEYKKLTDFERAEYIENKPREMRKEYGLITSDQPVVLQFGAVLSRYSDDSQGYLVRNFEDETFFPYNFAGADYAIIPSNLMDFQFLPVTDNAQRTVEKELAANRRRIRAVITVAPTGVSQEPMEMKGPDDKSRSYRLISAKVTNVELYTCGPKSCAALWSHGTKEYRDAERNQLLNLKQ